MALPISLTPKTFAVTEKECTIDGKYSIYGGDRAVLQCYEIDHSQNLINVALGKWRLFTKTFPWDSTQYPQVKATFRGSLLTVETDLEKHYRDQDEVVAEMLRKLNRDHTVFLSAATGFGKCFHPDEMLMLHSKAHKRVGDIITGDLLMGDDLLPRVVTSTILGRGMMYEVLVEGRTVLRCNGDHVLVLVDRSQWFYDSRYRNGYVEMSVEDYLGLEESAKQELRLANVNTCDRDSPKDSGKRGSDFGRDLKPLSEKEFREWSLQNFLCYVRTITKTFSDGGPTLEISTEGLDPTLVTSFLEASRRSGILVLHFPERLSIKVILGTSFPFTVRSVGEGDYAGFTVSGNNRRFLLANGLITHNTTIGCYLAAHSGLKVAVLCHIDKVKQQWVDALRAKTSGAKVQLVTKNSLDLESDYFVIGPQRVSKIPRDQLAEIGVVIVDEAHLTIKANFSSAVLCFQPLWLIGLSATPRRSDGLEKALEIYFGPKEKFIIRREKKPFSVVKVETDFLPDVRFNFRQNKKTLDWTFAVTSLALNKKRVAFIVDRLVKVLQDPDEYLLVLTLRVEEGWAVAAGLREAWENGEWETSGDDEPVFEAFSKKGKRGGIFGIDCYGETHRFKTIPPEASKYRVQVIGMKKGGVGYDDPTRTSEALLDSVIDVEQYEGRVRMVNSTIYDFVDNFGTHERHWESRQKYYLTKGATIEVEKGSSPRVQRGRPKGRGDIIIPGKTWGRK